MFKWTLDVPIISKVFQTREELLAHLLFPPPVTATPPYLNQKQDGLGPAASPHRSQSPENPNSAGCFLNPAAAWRAYLQIITAVDRQHGSGRRAETLRAAEHFPLTLQTDQWSCFTMCLQPMLHNDRLKCKAWMRSFWNQIDPTICIDDYFFLQFWAFK